MAASKAIHGVFGALFLYMAYIQLNDPDPLYWIVVYAGTGAVAFAKSLGESSEFWTAVLIGATAGGMIVAAPGFIDFVAAGDVAVIGDMGNAPYVEAAREFGGLSIAFCYLLFLFKTIADSSR